MLLYNTEQLVVTHIGLDSMKAHKQSAVGKVADVLVVLPDTWCVTYTLPIHNDDIKDEANQAQQLTIVSGRAVLQNPNVDVRMASELKYETHKVTTVHAK